LTNRWRLEYASKPRSKRQSLGSLPGFEIPAAQASFGEKNGRPKDDALWKRPTHASFFNNFQSFSINLVLRIDISAIISDGAALFLICTSLITQHPPS
jgi:hypothetical protein